MLLDITEKELVETYEEIQTILGGETIGVDITKKEVLIVMRRALREFNKETSIWQLKNQFGNMYGLPAGMVMTNQIATFNMNLIQQITDWFSSMARVGGKIPWKKDYIVLEPGRQIYDLSKESSKPYPPGARRIHRVMWVARPELFIGSKFTGNSDSLNGDDVINSGLWNFTTAGFNYGSSPLTYLGYAFDTVLLLQSMETRRKILFSEFFHNLSGDMLEISPMPGSKNLNIVPGTRVFYFYWNDIDVLTGRGQDEPDTASSTYTFEADIPSSDPDSQTYNPTLIANPLQMNLQAVPWSMLSDWAKTWIWEYTLARCKYIQGSKWRKIKKTMGTGEMDFEIEFDYGSLLTEAENEINKLREDLRSDMEKLNLALLYQEKDQIIEAAKKASKAPRQWYLG